MAEVRIPSKDLDASVVFGQLPWRALRERGVRLVEWPRGNLMVPVAIAAPFEMWRDAETQDLVIRQPAA